MQYNHAVDEIILVRDAQAGSRSAFAELIGHYHVAALRLAFHLVGSEADAQDLCQDAFLRAYQNIGNFRLESSFYTWLYRIVVNACLGYLRKRQTRKEHNPVTFDSNGEECDLLERLPDIRTSANPESELLRAEIGKRIQFALKRLSPRELIVFELRHFHGMRLGTIAEILQVGEGAIKTTLFRATRKMRSELSPARPHRFQSRVPISNEGTAKRGGMPNRNVLSPMPQCPTQRRVTREQLSEFCM